MAPALRRNAKNKKLSLKQLIFQGGRAPKDFTVRRQRTAAEFMDKWAANPQNYPKFGTMDWTELLANHINYGTKYPVSSMDVAFWLDTKTRFFGQWEQQLRRQVQMPTETKDGLQILRPRTEDTSVTDENTGRNEQPVQQSGRTPFEEYVRKLPHSAEFLAANINTEVKEELKDEPITENSPDTEGDEFEESLQLPEVLPREFSSGDSVPDLIRQLKDYSTILSKQIQELRISGYVPQTMENCQYTVNILNIFLAEGNANMPEA